MKNNFGKSDHMLIYSSKCIVSLNKKGITYHNENQEIKLEVNLKDETVWLTQLQMEKLFNVKHATISEHISNIFKEGVLDENTSV